MVRPCKVLIFAHHFSTLLSASHPLLTASRTFAGSLVFLSLIAFAHGGTHLKDVLDVRGCSCGGDTCEELVPQDSDMSLQYQMLKIVPSPFALRVFSIYTSRHIKFSVTPFVEQSWRHWASYFARRARFEFRTLS